MKYKFKRVVAHVSQIDLLALYLGIRVDVMLEGTHDRMEEPKKSRFKRVVAQASQTDHFALCLGI
ncbi:uncharacterized protein G2W53_033540 [Senna tora]|uniref:Uncharacterized protein n=1 Tax=Senna tora TaxID=362788 RepID=A0A834T9Q6_9FABA|nr:uncharacterized protein G2W53_033540 [Senna tora]